jgi:DNA-binding LacI/PurR family transcriptional regulator
VDELLSSEFRKFWDRFFQLRHWKHHHLAEAVGVTDDVVSKWVNGRNAISPQHMNQLLDSGFLSDTDEFGKLIRLSLTALGFSDRSLLHIATGLASSQATLQSLRRSRHQGQPSILALTPLLGGSPFYYSGILQELSELSVQHDLRMTVHPIPNRKAKGSLKDYDANLSSLRGVIAINCHVADSTWLDECRDSGVPLVLIHDNTTPDRYEGSGLISSIWEDLSGLEDCLDHLVRDHKCTSVRVVMRNPQSHLHRRRRMDVIVKRAETLGISLDPVGHVHLVDQYRYADGLTVGREIVESDDEAQAVLCLSDEVGLAVWQEAQRRGRPLRVTGFDNTPLAEYFGLASVDHHRRLTAERAILQLSSEAHHGTIEIRTVFVPRPSCCGSPSWTTSSIPDSPHDGPQRG